MFNDPLYGMGVDESPKHTFSKIISTKIMFKFLNLKLIESLFTDEMLTILIEQFVEIIFATRMHTQRVRVRFARTFANQICTLKKN